MKNIIALVLLASWLLAGCSSPSQNRAALSKDQEPRLYVTLAVFGTGSATKEVTSQVRKLLRSSPHAFTADAKTLGTDPAPYKSKTLVIDYTYGGRPYRFSVVGKQGVSAEALIEHAQGKPAEKKPRPKPVAPEPRKEAPAPAAPPDYPINSVYTAPVSPAASA